MHEISLPLHCLFAKKKKKHDSTNVGHCRQRVKKVSAVCIKLSF